MSFPYEKAIELLESAHANGRLAHAYLIIGPPGSGKERLAIRTIEMVNERDREKAATSLEELRSSSTTVIAPESRSRRIGVEAIRNVEHVLQMAAPAGVTKFAVVKDADRMGQEAENAFLERHSWEEYAAWHLGLTEGARDHTKARYAFVYGDFRRVHRSGLIACVYRASEWRHKAVELAAHDLLQRLDAAAGIT